MKMIVVDLDGTLLNSSKQIDDYSVEVLSEVMKNGHIIVFATARPYRDIKRILPDNLNKNVVICYNGATVISDDKVLFEKGITYSVTRNILNHFLDHNYYQICLEINDKLYSNFNTKEFFGSSEFELIDLNTFDYDLVHKIIVCSKDGIKQRIVDNIPTECSPVITDDATLCQIMSTNISKWNAIEYLIEMYGVQRSNIISFGNDFNDFEMIKYSSVGVAMGNAIDELKEIANYITTDNDNYGVARYLKGSVLNA
ncbi:Cof-type HAD-IIB family hydrolase [Bacillus sp. XF8]|uniref:Cof-type HAD-IIB family hydrolase n=1 Tax=Bacillus sp. XF8 TaxID=2819289 RepID=UPI001AA070AF|nr:Cof-type HAD-IIB family hydrolase [Bacillus sp. XF8]MBO1582888.1 HAD family phosphatase [Bacillus sp. XF8]